MFIYFPNTDNSTTVSIQDTTTDSTGEGNIIHDLFWDYLNDFKDVTMLHKYFLNRCIVVTIGKPTDRARGWAAVWQPNHKSVICQNLKLSSVSFLLWVSPWAWLHPVLLPCSSGHSQWYVHAYTLTVCCKESVGNHFAYEIFKHNLCYTNYLHFSIDKVLRNLNKIVIFT